MGTRQRLHSNSLSDWIGHRYLSVWAPNFPLPKRSRAKSKTVELLTSFNRISCRGCPSPATKIARALNLRISFSSCPSRTCLQGVLVHYHQIIPTYSTAHDFRVFQTASIFWVSPLEEKYFSCRRLLSLTGTKDISFVISIDPYKPPILPTAYCASAISSDVCIVRPFPYLLPSYIHIEREQRSHGFSRPAPNGVSPQPSH